MQKQMDVETDQGASWKQVEICVCVIGVWSVSRHQQTPHDYQIKQRSISLQDQEC